MPPANLLRDTWSKGRAHAEEDASLVADLIYGHLMHHFSNPEVFLGWSEDSALRIRSILTGVARFNQRVPPSYALRALLVVLSMKDKPGMKNSTAPSYNAEILWMVAFWKLAGRLYPSFNIGMFLYYTHPWPSGNKDYCDKTFVQVPRMLDPYLREALTLRRRLSDASRARKIMRFWLAPWAAVTDTPRLDGILAESPAMRTHNLYTPRLLSEPSQSLATVLPASRRDFHRKQRLSPIVDEEEPPSGDEDDVGTEESFTTNSSFIDSLADESFATTSTSLTSVGTAAGPGDYIPLSPLVSIFSSYFHSPSSSVSSPFLSLLRMSLSLQSHHHHHRDRCAFR